MKCDKCDVSLNARSLYCSDCGNKVGSSCLRCSTALWADDVFCSGCGAEISTLAPVLDKPTGAATTFDCMFNELDDDQEYFSASEGTLHQQEISKLFKKRKDE